LYDSSPRRKRGGNGKSFETTNEAVSKIIYNCITNVMHCEILNWEKVTKAGKGSYAVGFILNQCK
jgi:hypothetical protein